jgi:flavodoxin I
MKVLIACFSQTGNTEKIARAIRDELSGGHETRLVKIDEIEPDAAGGYDVVFVGSPCHAGDLSAQAKSFLAGLPQQGGFAVAGFITHASSAYERGGFEKCIVSFETISSGKGIPYLGCFDCQGFLSPEIQPYVKKARKVTDEEWDAIIEKMNGHPDAEDERKAREFAREVTGKVK